MSLPISQDPQGVSRLSRPNEAGQPQVPSSTEFLVKAEPSKPSLHPEESTRSLEEMAEAPSIRGKVLIGLGIALAVATFAFAPYIGILIAVAAFTTAGIGAAIGVTVGGGILGSLVAKAGVSIMKSSNAPPQETEKWKTIAKAATLPMEVVGGIYFDVGSERDLENDIQRQLESLSDQMTEKEIVEYCQQLVLPRNPTEKQKGKVAKEVRAHLKHLTEEGRVLKLHKDKVVTYSGTDEELFRGVARKILRDGQASRKDIERYCESETTASSFFSFLTPKDQKKLSKQELADIALSVLEERGEITKYQQAGKLKKEVYIPFNQEIADRIESALTSGFSGSLSAGLSVKGIVKMMQERSSWTPSEDVIEQYLAWLETQGKVIGVHADGKSTIYWLYTEKTALEMIDIVQRGTDNGRVAKETVDNARRFVDILVEKGKLTKRGDNYQVP